MEFLDEEKLAHVREFIRRFQAELILLALSGVIILASGVLFTRIPVQAKTISNVQPTLKKSVQKVQEDYIFVDISGAVEYPDVYKLLANTRLKAAIEKAGGYSEQANIEEVQKSMNMSRLLVDQEKIYVPKLGDSVLSTIVQEDVIVRINSASPEKLDRLTGVGSATAQKIIDGRPYAALSDLVTKKILGKALFEKIRDQIAL